MYNLYDDGTRKHDALLDSPSPKEAFCWICRGKETDAELIKSDWVRPCMCKNDKEFVHESCFKEYILSFKYKNSYWNLTCDTCHCLHKVFLGKPNFLYRIQQFIDNVSAMITYPPILAAAAGASFFDFCRRYSLLMIYLVDDVELYVVLNESSFIESTLMLFSFPTIVVYLESYNWEHYIGKKLTKFLFDMGLFDSIIMTVLKCTHALPTLTVDNNFGVMRIEQREGDHAFYTLFDSSSTDSSSDRDETRSSEEIDSSEVSTDISTLLYPRYRYSFISNIVTGLLLPLISAYCGNIILPTRYSGVSKCLITWFSIQAFRGVFRILTHVATIHHFSTFKVLSY